ncbi:MAG TPA: hypothetical protein ENI56_00330 [Candidatus Kaiserbacteria bacterium]|nr:hypothetical protein [Candidatus Kaiserbacteria bacterium]
MTLWYKKSVIFILAGISYIVGQYLRGVWFNPSWPFPCQEIHSGSVIYCNAPYLAQGFALITLGETLAIVALILLFANARAFHKWLKFSYWYVSLSALFVIYMTPLPLVPLASPLSSERAIYDLGVVWQYITAGIVIVYLVIALVAKIKARRENVK